MRVIKILALLLVSMAIALPAIAGECGVGDERSLVEDLERLTASGLLDSQSARWRVMSLLQCLSVWPESEWRWAGAVTAKRFQALRESPFRDRIVTGCTRSLDLSLELEPPDSALAFACGRVLASRGASHSGKHDVLWLLVSYSRQRHRELPWYDIAALRERRVLPVLRVAYDSLAALPRSESSVCAKIQLVNVLYYVPDDSSMALAREIAATDTDSVVVDRARYVVEARQP